MLGVSASAFPVVMEDQDSFDNFIMMNTELEKYQDSLAALEKLKLEQQQAIAKQSQEIHNIQNRLKRSLGQVEKAADIKAIRISNEEIKSLVQKPAEQAFKMPDLGSNMAQKGHKITLSADINSQVYDKPIQDKPAQDKPALTEQKKKHTHRKHHHHKAAPKKEDKAEHEDEVVPKVINNDNTHFAETKKAKAPAKKIKVAKASKAKAHPKKEKTEDD